MKYLIAGLGNIGPEYANTRHNIGFLVADELNRQLEGRFTSERHAFYSECSFKGRKVYVIKPTTYMNLSGKAVSYWMNELKISKENLLVITDDLALDFGTIRIKAKGSDGGHNGLKSIQEVLTSTDYARLRFGIGNSFSKGKQVDYVLSEWNPEERKSLPERIDQCVEATKEFCFAGITNAMNKFNGK